MRTVLEAERMRRMAMQTVGICTQAKYYEDEIYLCRLGHQLASLQSVTMDSLGRRIDTKELNSQLETSVKRKKSETLTLDVPTRLLNRTEY